MQGMFNINLESTLKKFQVQLKRVGGGAKFFSAAGKRGESVELHNDLNSNDRELQKNALKRIIANMTLGRDVSQLFADVVKLGQTPNLEVKKLVYLYVLNNAKLQPDKALMAVNTFLQDASHSSPIVRALALRTMLCLRVDAVLEYTIPPLITALNTSGEADAYVRKTAAIGIGKVYHQNPALFETHGLMGYLTHLLADPFPVVSSNAAAILAEIITANVSGSQVIEIQKVWATKLLNALPDCTEWGQVYILEALSLYQPSQDEVETLADRILPRLSHANPAIVLGTVKLLAILVTRMPLAVRTPYISRISTAMLTLAKSDPETQYIMCRNAQMLLNLFPDLLSEHLESFFIRFSDPPYVKLEKLRLLLRLVNSNSAASVIKEFSEYVHEVDPVLIAQVVNAISIIAVKVESVAERAAVLLKEIVTLRPEILPQGLVAAMGMLRKYPNLVIDIVPPLFALGADCVQEENARAAYVWMLGEFCEIVEQGQELLTAVTDTLDREEPSVQAAALTAVMKAFLRNPAATEQMLQKTLNFVTRGTRNPDLRDRGLLYYRLLSKGIPVAQLTDIVLAKKPVMDTSSTFHDNMTNAEMLRSVNTVAAVYAQPPRRFLPTYGCQNDPVDDEDEEEYPDEAVTQDLPPVTALPENMTVSTPTARTHADPVSANGMGAAGGRKPISALDDLDSLFGPPAAAASTQVAHPSDVSQNSAPPNTVEVVNAGIAAGATLRAAFTPSEAAPVAVYIALTNNRTTAIESVAMQVNRNRFSLAPALQIELRSPVLPAATKEFLIPLAPSETHYVASSSFAVQLGVSLNGTIYTFTLEMPKRLALTFAKELEKSEFARQWQSFDASCERTFRLQTSMSVDAVVSQLSAYRIVKIATVPRGSESMLFLCCKMHTGVMAFIELVIPGGTVTLRSARISEAVEVLQPVMLDALSSTPPLTATSADPMHNFW